MPKKRREEEFSVTPTILKRREKPLIEDTTGVEQLAVFRASKRVGRVLSGVIIAAGALLLLFSVYAAVSGAWFTVEMRSPVIFLMGFIGVINTLCGLVLLAKE